MDFFSFQNQWFFYLSYGFEEIGLELNFFQHNIIFFVNVFNFTRKNNKKGHYWNKLSPEADELRYVITVNYSISEYLQFFFKVLMSSETKRCELELRRCELV